MSKKAVLKKVITPPEEEFKGAKIKPSNYLVTNDDGYNFLLFREINQSEVEDYKEEFVIVTEGKKYMLIINLPSEEDAMVAIKSYWRAIKELNSMSD